MWKHSLKSVIVSMVIGSLISGLGAARLGVESSGFWPFALTAPARALTCEYPTPCPLPPISIGLTTIDVGQNTGYPSSNGGAAGGGWLSSGVGWGAGGGVGGLALGSVGILAAVNGRLPNIDFNNSQGQSGTTCVGDPINLATGSQFESQIDYSSAGSFPLVLARYYNSLETNGVHEFGFNWRGSYSRNVSLSGATATATRDDGQVLTFTFVNGAWTKPGYLNYRLSQTASGFILITDQDETETYDAAGKLRSYVNRAGQAQTFAYDALNRLVGVLDPFGRTLAFSYNSSSLLSQAVRPDGGVYAYGYDTNSRLTSVTYPDGSRRQYLYENSAQPRAMTGLIDENGSRYATYAYDSAGRAVSSQHAGGADLITVDYSILDSFGIARFTTPLGGVEGVRLTGINGLAKPIFDVRQDLSPMTNKAYDYDTQGNLIGYKDSGDNQTQFVYDLTRNLTTSATFASGTSVARTITTSWHPNLRLPTQIVDGSRSFEFTYDAKGNLLTSTLVSPGITSKSKYTYNGSGQVLTVTDPLNNVTSYAYDAAGNLVTITNALGQVLSLANYDANGLPRVIRDANGVESKLTYNFRAQITSSITLGQATTYAYDKVGLLTKVSLPSGTVLNYSYDAAHRLISVSNGSGVRIVYTLDAAGNRVKEQLFDPSGALIREHTRTYDSYSRLAQDIGASHQVSTFYFDGDDNLISMTDPNGNTGSLAYDALHRISQATDPVGGKTSYAYDANGRLSAVTDPRGLVTRYTNNALDETTNVVSPDTGSSSRNFDPAGNVRTSIDARGQTTAYSYDALNRLVRATYADGSVTSYGYDQGTYGVGRLTSISDKTGATSWAYDASGHVVQKTQTTGSVTLVTKWSYDPATGLLVSMTYPSGYSVFYAYDANARVRAVSLQAAGQAPALLIDQVSYSASGSVASWRQAASGGIYLRRFDQDGRITSIVSSTGNSMSLAYDAGSRIVSITESGRATKTFSYDSNDRLAGYAIGGSPIVYAYDPSGNRTSVSGFSYSTDPGSNRLTSVTGGGTTQVLAYDPAGGLTNKGGTLSLAYDARGRLAQAGVGALVTTYGVNGLGQRVSKNGSVTGQAAYAYDLSGGLLGTYGAAGAAREEILWLDGLPVAAFQNGAVYYIAPDHLGAPHQIVNATNQPVWFWDHDPFGRGAPAAVAGFAHNLRFPGQIYDVETGLHYNGFRDYSPELGRYVESDPIGLAGGINTYSYALNDPVTLTDPSGRFVPLPVLALAAVGVLYSGGANAPGSCSKIAGSAEAAPYLAIAGGGLGGFVAGRALGFLGSGPGTALGVAGVPGRVASRINLSNKGMEHVIARHLSGKANASQFSLSEAELRSVMSSRAAANSPIVRSLESADEIMYVREFDAGRVVGADRFNGNQATSVMTIMTDRFGNLVSAFPGLLR